MSKHWSPKRNGWTGQWERHRWPMPAGKRRPARRLPRFSWAELRLTLLGGVFLGLMIFHNMSGWVGSDSRDGGIRIAGAVRVIDGDTFVYGGERIRIADIDTPEVHGRCPYETELAARATSRMRGLLAAGPFELRALASGRDEDRYGRKLRIVTRNGQSLGDQLVAEGLARTWTGRREPWCV